MNFVLSQGNMPLSRRKGLIRCIIPLIYYRYNDQHLILFLVSSDLKVLNFPLVLQSVECQEDFDGRKTILCSMNDGKCKHIYERNKHFQI